jgi:hypothetical protein
VSNSLQPFGPEIWIARGSEAEVAGFRYPTRMVVVRLAGGGLFAWSPVALSGSLMVEAEASVPRKFRAAFVDRQAARNALRRILDWPAGKVLMAHGAPVEHDGRTFIARAFPWLKAIDSPCTNA